MSSSIGFAAVAVAWTASLNTVEVNWRLFTAMIFVAGATPAFSAGRPTAMSLTVPSSFTSMPSEYIKFTDFAYSSWSFHMADGILSYANFQPPSSIPPNGAWGAVDVSRSRRNFDQSYGATEFKPAATSSNV